MSTHSSRGSSHTSRQPLGTVTNSRIKENYIASSESSISESQLKADTISKIQTDCQICPLCKGHDQYVKVLQDALREVLDQNEVLRIRVIELEALISKSEDEIQEKNNLIAELEATLPKSKPKPRRRRSTKKNSNLNN